MNPDITSDRITAPSSENGENGVRPTTACFNCRALRQRCDRQLPCVAIHWALTAGDGMETLLSVYSLEDGNASVDKLLARMSETTERDQVVAALLNIAGTQQPQPHQQQQQEQHNASYSSSPPPDVPSEAPSPTPSTQPASGAPASRLLTSLVSPLHIMAAAVTANTSAYASGQTDTAASGSRFPGGKSVCVDERLIRYFSQPTPTKDWTVLASQSIDSPLKLETSTCDPIAARLIDMTDAAWYFKMSAFLLLPDSSSLLAPLLTARFFKYRGPLIGLLDPLLHTPDYVHTCSFVLFSALCALGCAISDRPRDRVLYPALQSIADANIKWAIAMCVKSIEIVQSIVIMQYWTPVCPRQSDDPYWLRLSHAVQLGREMGLHRPAAIAEQVQALVAGSTVSTEFHERLLRNYERTWLYTFIADRGFGIITGRRMGVTWKEIPAAASEWWRKPMTVPADRVVSGLVELRGLFLNALELRKSAVNSREGVARWHAQVHRSLEQTRIARCRGGDGPTARYLPVLGFYMDHSIMVLNSQALRDLSAMGGAAGGGDPVSPELLEISRKNVDVAGRLLDALLSNDVLLELMPGFHNNQFIMVCHAATEMIYAIQRGGLAAAVVEHSAAQVRAIPHHLDKVAAMLPSTSAAPLYASLSRFFVCQLNKVMSCDEANEDERGESGERGEQGERGERGERGEPEQESLLTEWWRTVDGSMLDATTWMDLGFLNSAEMGP